MQAERECKYQYYESDDPDSLDHRYTVSAVLGELKPGRVFDLGCGNGSVANTISQHGYEVIGVDPSASGIELARKRYPHIRFESGSAYDDLASRFGRFANAICLEVIEHLFDPKACAATLFSLLQAGGLVLISTPYHGYLKNLAIAASGNSDRHADPLWDCGHIKFFSREKMTQLLGGAGFTNVRHRRLGRIAPFAKSMLSIAERPQC